MLTTAPRGAPSPPARGGDQAAGRPSAWLPHPGSAKPSYASAWEMTPVTTRTSVTSIMVKSGGVPSAMQPSAPTTIPTVKYDFQSGNDASGHRIAHRTISASIRHSTQTPTPAAGTQRQERRKPPAMCRPHELCAGRTYQRSGGHSAASMWHAPGHRSQSSSAGRAAAAHARHTLAELSCACRAGCTCHTGQHEAQQLSSASCFLGSGVLIWLKELRLARIAPSRSSKDSGSLRRTSVAPLRGPGRCDSGATIEFAGTAAHCTCQ